jgi:hypothetical protein
MTALFDLGRATEKSFWFSSFDTLRGPNARFDGD